MLMVRSKAQTNERSRIRHGLVLPTLVSLVASQSLLGGVIPIARRLAVHVMLAKQSFLNLSRSLVVDGCLSADVGLFGLLTCPMSALRCVLASLRVVGRNVVRWSFVRSGLMGGTLLRGRMGRSLAHAQ